MIRFRHLALLLLAAGAAALDPNPPPLIDQQPTTYLREDFADTTITLTGLYAGPNGGGPFIGVAATSSDHAILPDPTVVYNGSASTAQLIFASAPNAFGTATVTVSVRDQSLFSPGVETRMSFLVDILPINDPPRFIMSLPTNTMEDDDLQVIFLNLASPGPANESDQRLSLVVTPLDTSLIDILNVSIDQASGVIMCWIRPKPDAWGTTTLVVTLIDDGGDWGDGLDSFSRVGSLRISPVNDPPVLAALRPLAVGVGGQVAITASDLRISDVDDPDPATLRFILDTEPQHGSLRLSGVALAQGGTFTQADIAAGLVSYRHDGSGPGADGFAVLYDDGVVATPLGPVGVAVAVAGRALPSVALLGGPATWMEGGSPAAPAPDAEVVDDTAAFIGGFLNVAITYGEGGGDRLGFAEQGVGAGEVSSDATTVSVGGRVVGTWSGGSGQPLEVRFTSADATPAAIQSLIRALRFWSTSRDPSATTRSIRVVVDDGDSGASIPTTTTVAVVPFDDPPASDQVTVATLPGTDILVHLIANDPDTAPLTWAVIASPACARLELVDAAAGWFRLAPSASGNGIAFASVSDGVNDTVIVPVTVVVGSADAAAPHPAAEPPRAIYAGDTLDLTVPFDCRDLPAGTSLDFAASPDAPLGMTIGRAGPTTLHLAWNVPLSQPTASHLRFRVVAFSTDGSAVGVLPISLRILPHPAGAN